MIRTLHPDTDLAAVTAFLAEAADYWIMEEGTAPGHDAARDFVTDSPPGCDPAQSHHLGLFHDGQLAGLAELSFGFPQAGDAYLGLMILAPRLRGLGLGPSLLAHVETLARAAGAPQLYLAVLEANIRGRAFWDRHGFRPTGLSRIDNDHGLNHTIHRLVKPL
jgi:GNAT superfamily N-acetyltransferase